ncbi:porin [Marimonas arenosa]|uniref:Porin n=1 Tax=Marimonas arenosa TaxID=1795305 RepID=A0AAE3WE47_9RHOB|nr:porin [Marimonas arenosa]MDQ2090833.1 porin [Marimonas arenosa]
MKKTFLAVVIGGSLAAPAMADLRFDGYGWFGALYDDATDKTNTTSRLRLTLDGETQTDNGIELSFRLRVQADNGGLATFNGARFGLRSGPLRLQLGNVAGAIDSMPGLSGVEPGLTDLTGQTAALRADFDEYDNTGPGRNGVAVRYSQGQVQVSLSHSNTGGVRRTAGHVAYFAGPGGLAIGYQVSDRAADDDLVVLVYRHRFEWGEASLFSAREQAGNVFGASALWEGSETTSLLASASVDNGREQYGVGIAHDLGSSAFLETGIASDMGNVTADFGVRFEF